MKIDSDLLIRALDLDDCPKFCANRISIDSRTIEKDDLFIAINRGHEFVKDALNKSLSKAIIDDPSYAIPQKTILVNNTTEALKSIGKYIKDLVNLKKVIGITGSVGKTTTRTWLNNILNNKVKSFASIRNYNTIYGLPLSLSLLEKNTDLGIFELGSNNPGEIAELSNYLEPDIAVITNIYESHIGKFGNQENLAKEKISILEGIKPNGKLIFDGDSVFRDMIQEKAKQADVRYFSVGFNKNCDFQILPYDQKIHIRTPFGEIEYELNVLGKQFVYITACIVAIIHASNLDVVDFLPYFKNLSQINGRGELKEYKFKDKIFKIIDDSYNASPSAVSAAIDNFKLYPGNHKTFVLGQMKELGSYEEYYHNLVAEKLRDADFEQTVFIGDKSLWPTMEQVKNIVCFEKIDKFVIEKILEMVQNDGIILLKGSSSIELNKFIDYIKCSTT